MCGTEKFKARSDLAAIELAIRTYIADHEERPPADVWPSLAAYLAIDSCPVDPWGRRYLYEHARDSSFVVRSFGKDGLPGGTGLDEDIESGNMR